MNGTIRYTIRPYDTIWMLAQVFNTTVDSIMELNPGIDPRNLQIGQVITIMPGYSYYPEIPGERSEFETDMGMDMGMDMDMDMDMPSEMLMDLNNYFRMLWEQHVIWTRLAVLGIVHDLPETDLIVQRLLRNPVDFANAFANFFSEEEAQTFADLLTAHLTIAAELFTAMKSGDTNTAADAEQRWFENADRIAAFLASINPSWSEEDWSAMLEEHLTLLRDNAVNMLAQNYEESINGFDDIESQALEMADVMAEGIYNQFGR